MKLSTIYLSGTTDQKELERYKAELEELGHDVTTPIDVEANTAGWMSCSEDDRNAIRLMALLDCEMLCYILPENSNDTDRFSHHENMVAAMVNKPKSSARVIIHDGQKALAAEEVA